MFECVNLYSRPLNAKGCNDGITFEYLVIFAITINHGSDRCLEYQMEIESKN